MPSTEVDEVAIVGLGPVGGVVAALLGRQGHRVVVLERHPTPYPLPRAVHFDDEVARILQACGLGPDLGALSEPGRDYEWRNGAGQVLLRFGGRPVGPSGWPASNMFCQPELEARIEAAAAAQPTVEVRRGARVVALSEGGDGAALTVESTTGEPPEVLTARYVVGAGQGMGSGLRDAINLAWKLDLVLSGAAPDALLDAYERERADNVRAVIDLSMSLGRVICMTDPEEAAARDTAMAARAAERGPQAHPALPGVTAGLIRADDEVSGRLFVQGRVAGPDGPTRLDDLVGGGWRLVTVDPAMADALPGAVSAWFATIGGQVVTVDVSNGADVDGTYARWFADHGVASVLQRPDFHLFGACSDLDGVGPLLDDLRTSLTHPCAADPHGADP